jgi:hypothetical protein
VDPGVADALVAAAAAAAEGFEEVDAQPPRRLNPAISAAAATPAGTPIFGPW